MFFSVSSHVSSLTWVALAWWLAAASCVGKPLFSLEVSATTWSLVSACRTELREQLATPTPNRKKKPPAQHRSKARRRTSGRSLPRQAQGDFNSIKNKHCQQINQTCFCSANCGWKNTLLIINISPWCNKTFIQYLGSNVNTLSKTKNIHSQRHSNIFFFFFTTKFYYLILCLFSLLFVQFFSSWLHIMLQWWWDFPQRRINKGNSNTAFWIELN